MVRAELSERRRHERSLTGFAIVIAFSATLTTPWPLPEDLDGIGTPSAGGSYWGSPPGTKGHRLALVFETRGIPLAIWRILKQSVAGFIAHEALSRGAAIAFYIVTSLAPVLLIVVAVAGLVFGQAAVRGSLVKELGGLFGKEGGELIQTMLASTADKATSTAASIFGVLMVIVTASGVFGEMQTALNKTWDVGNSNQRWFSLIKTRAASLGLVAALGFLLMVSLTASAGLSAFGNYVGAHTAFAPLILSFLNTIISLLLFTLLFAAIFKVLPDTPIAWRDVGIGAFVTAILFTIGKSLIGWYLGTTAASSGYGAAGALILILLWSYYSAQIFLFGAEITRAVAGPPLEQKDVADAQCDQQLRSPPAASSLQSADKSSLGKLRSLRSI
jgi:membrane protein